MNLKIELYWIGYFFVIISLFIFVIIEIFNIFYEKESCLTNPPKNNKKLNPFSFIFFFIILILLLPIIEYIENEFIIEKYLSGKFIIIFILYTFFFSMIICVPFYKNFKPSKNKKNNIIVLIGSTYFVWYFSCFLSIILTFNSNFLFDYSKPQEHIVSIKDYSISKGNRSPSLIHIKIEPSIGDGISSLVFPYLSNFGSLREGDKLIIFIQKGFCDMNHFNSKHIKVIRRNRY